MPQVSVIIPTYNRKAYVQEAIDSVLVQTYTDYEIIVIDDGSTDGTGAALQARYGDKIHYVWQQNQGESVARNKGLEMARGEFIAFLDSDDLWLPEKLNKQVAYLTAHPKVDLLFGRAQLIDQHGQPMGKSIGRAAKSFDKKILYFWNPIGGPSTTLIRQTALDKAGNFDANIKFGEDWDLWFRVAAENNVVPLDEVLTCIRRHRDGQAHYPSADKNAERLADRLKMLTKAFVRDNVSEEFQRTVLARQYAQAFIWEKAVGNQENAIQNLRLANDLDAHFVLSDKMGHLITAHLSQLADEAAVTTFDLALAALQEILQDLHDVCGPNRPVERAIKAQVYTAFSFIALRTGQSDRTRRYAALAIYNDRRCLTNFGLLKNLVRGFVPHKHNQNKEIV